MLVIRVKRLFVSSHLFTPLHAYNYQTCEDLKHFFMYIMRCNIEYYAMFVKSEEFFCARIKSYNNFISQIMKRLFL